MRIERELLTNLLFKKSDFNIESKINYQKLIKVASSHLMIPSLYINILKKKKKNILKKSFWII